MKGYNDFNSVEELYEYYKITPKNIILEDKHDEPEKVQKTREVLLKYGAKER